MPISRKPHLECSARLVWFSAMICACKVQYASASEAAIRPSRSPAPIPFPCANLSDSGGPSRIRDGAERRPTENSFVLPGDQASERQVRRVPIGPRRRFAHEGREAC